MSRFIVPSTPVANAPRTRDHALVTGGNRGIGLEVCRQLAERGMRVFLTARSLDKAQRAAAPLAAKRLDVVPLELDVASVESIRLATTAIEAMHAHVDVLVNNAAILVAEYEGVLDLELDDVRATFETNVFGVLTLCQALVPGMVKRRHGRVVNVSSGGRSSRASPPTRRPIPCRRRR